MGAAFTPGPWRAYERRRDTWAVLARRTPDHVNPRSESSIVSAVGGDAAMKAANARLIAAAPELYEALREIAAGLADTGSTPGQWMTRIRKDEAHKIASAALAKVRP